MKELRAMKVCPQCNASGMKILIRNRDVMCQYHWQLLTPELRREVKWNNKAEQPEVKIDWFVRASKYLETSGDMFVNKNQNNDSGGTLVNWLTGALVVLVIVLALAATLTLVK